MSKSKRNKAIALSHVYLSPDELVERLPGVSKGTLAMWRSEGRGPKYRKVGRVVLYALDEIEAWLDASAREGTKSFLDA